MLRCPSKKEMIKVARRIFQEEGSIEIDKGARISRGKGNPDKGAYVQAWVWVADQDTRRKERKEPCF